MGATRFNSLCCVGIMLALLSLEPFAIAQQFINLQGLGDLPGGAISSEASRVNDAGQVVGASRSIHTLYSGEREAFLWSESTGIVGLFDIPGGWYWSEAFDINNTGGIAGYGGNASYNWDAVLWRQNGLDGRVSLGVASGFTSSFAEGINDNGWIVGWNADDVGRHKAFLFGGTATGIMRDLGDLAGGAVDSIAKDINNSGVVIGFSASTLGTEAFLWTETDGIVGMGELPGGAYLSVAMGISNAGHIVGESTSNLGTEAFLWTQFDGMVGLGDLPGGTFRSTAYDVNDSGYVVGRGRGISDQYEAILWTAAEGMRSLNSIVEDQQVPGARGWFLINARGINRHGDIVGTGYNPNGYLEAFYLKASREPVDEDEDGLSDDEEAESGTDPANPDTDGDGLSDGDEVHIHGTDPLLADTDADGLTDSDEINVHGTSPVQPDSDSDGLPDGDEIDLHHTDPLQADTDGDGLSDGDEVNIHGTDPLEEDTDGDGFSDGTEIENGTDPLTSEDTTPPSPLFDSNVPYLTNQPSFALSITFDEHVIGFTAGDIQILNASMSGFAVVVPGRVCTFILQPLLPGYVEARVPAGAATDLAGNGNVESALGWEFDPVRPSCFFQSQLPYITGQSTIPVTIRFSEYITGFAASDIQTTNASVSGFTVIAPGLFYTVNLVPALGRFVTATLPSGAVTDLAGNPNTGSPAFYRFYTSTPSVCSITQYAIYSGGRFVQYQVQFNEPVLGVDTNDFRLNISGIVGARIAGVSGSGDTHMVVVDTGNRSGTLQLQLVDTDSIWSYTFTPLGGWGYGNGNSSGPVFSR